VGKNKAFKLPVESNDHVLENIKHKMVKEGVVSNKID